MKQRQDKTVLKRTKIQYDEGKTKSNPTKPPKGSNPTQGKIKALQVPSVKHESLQTCLTHSQDPSDT